MRLGYHTITWGGVVGNASGVTSVQDLYYASHGSITQAAADIAGVGGYEGIEVFDGNLLPYEAEPAELTERLSSLGLELVSVYCGANFIYADLLPDELHRITHSARMAQRFGASQLVVGGGAVRAQGPQTDDWDRLAKGLDAVTDLAAEHGLTASYHPHLGTIGETPAQLRRVMDVSRIAFCPDTAHLAAGGGDPAGLITEYGDRLAHVHLKDVDLATTTFQPLGRGDLDFQSIVQAVRDAGYDDWLIVELDAYGGDPAEAAVISRDHLRPLL